MNTAKDIQALIDSTSYWDEEILDVKFSSFGDVIKIFVKDNELTSWVISFIRCSEVKYETDASWRGPVRVSFLSEAQRGYFGQSIEVTFDENNNIYHADINLTILSFSLTCYEVEVEKTFRNC